MSACNRCGHEFYEHVTLGRGHGCQHVGPLGNSCACQVRAKPAGHVPVLACQGCGHFHEGQQECTERLVLQGALATVRGNTFTSAGSTVTCRCPQSNVKLSAEVNCAVCSCPVLLHDGDARGCAACHCEHAPPVGLYLFSPFLNEMLFYTGSEWINDHETRWSLPQPLQEDVWRLTLRQGCTITTGRDDVYLCRSETGGEHDLLHVLLRTAVKIEEGLAAQNPITLHFERRSVALEVADIDVRKLPRLGRTSIEFVGTVLAATAADPQLPPHVISLDPELS